MSLRRNLSGWGKLPWRRLLTATIAAVAILAYWTQLGERHERAAARELPAGSETRDSTTPSRSSVGFANARRLDEHYDKHGGQFGRITKQDYLRQAQLLRDAQVG